MVSLGWGTAWRPVWFLSGRLRLLGDAVNLWCLRQRGVSRAAGFRLRVAGRWLPHGRGGGHGHAAGLVLCWR